MELTQEQYERIQDCLPVQRGKVRHDNLVLLNAVLYVAEHRMQVARLAPPVRQWAQHLCTHEPLGLEGGVRSGVRQTAARADSAA